MKPKSEHEARVSFGCSPEFKRRLEEVAALDRRSVTAWCRLVLEDALARGTSVRAGEVTHVRRSGFSPRLPNGIKP